MKNPLAWCGTTSLVILGVLLACTTNTVSAGGGGISTTMPVDAKQVRCRELVFAEYRRLAGIIGATETQTRPLAFRIGYSIRGFAEAGDELWQVVWQREGPPSFVRGVFWFNPKTETLRAVAGTWQSPTGVSSGRPALAPTTQVDPNFAQRAKELAAAEFEWLTARKMMDDKLQGTERVRDPVEIKVGCEINGFSRSDETLFEAVVELVRGDERQLRGIFWVSPRTGQVYAVAGVWQPQ